MGKKPACSNQYAGSPVPFEVEILDQKTWDSVWNNLLNPNILMPDSVTHPIVHRKEDLKICSLKDL